MAFPIIPILKKVAVTLVTDKKARKVILGIVLGIIFVILMTACSDKIVEQIQNEIGAILEGGNFKEGSILNMIRLDVTEEQADEIFEKLEGIGVEIDDKTKAYIYDIFVSKDNQEVQPDGTVKITVPMPQEGAENGYLVYHIGDDGNAVKIPSTYSDGKLSFETDGFSYYVIVAGEYVKTNGKYQHTLTVTAEPANSGYIMIDGEEKDVSNGILLNDGTTYELYADGNKGYVFIGWYDADSNEIISKNSKYSVKLSGDLRLIAKFEKTNESDGNTTKYQHTLTVTAEPANSGHIAIDGEEKDASGGIALNAGEFYSLQAIENEGYVFVGWYDGDELLAEDDVYSHYLNKSCNLVAKFKETPYTLNLTRTEGGLTSLNGESITSQIASESIDRNASVTLQASAWDLYEFIGWYNAADSALLSDSATYTFTMDGDKSIEAHFKHLPVEVSVTMTHEGAGYFVLADNTACTEIDKQMDVDAIFTIRVVENFGYQFLHWKDADANVVYELEECTISVTENGVNYLAVFEELPNHLVVTATDGGKINATVNGEASDGLFVTEYKNAFRISVKVNLYAEEDVGGYRFVGWYDEAGELLKNDHTYTVWVDGEVTLEARFEKIVEYTVTATAGEGGTITDGYANGKKVENGTSVTLTATPNKKYHFIGWFVGENKVYDNASYTFTVNENTTLVAKFEKDPPVKVSVTVTPEGGGYFVLADGTTCTEIDDQMEVGTSFTVEVVANFGYQFLHWEDVDTNEVYHYGYGARTISVTESGVNYRAVFEELPHQLFVTATDGGKINVTVNGETTEGAFVSEYKNAFRNPTTVELSAQENVGGYRFVGWYDEKGKLLNRNFDYTVSVDGEVTLEARFEKIVEYTVTATAGEGGTVTDGYANGKKFEKGTSVTLTATANNNYNFIGWFSGETKVSDNASYTFTVNENTTLVAKFEKIEYTVTATAGEGGTVTDGYANGKKFEKGTSVTLTATANDHYDFIGWFVGENEVSGNESYTFTVNENITLVAKFEKKTYRFLCNIQGNGSIWENNANATETYRYGATLSAGTKITLTAKPDTYWQFKGWYQSGGTSLISTDATYTFELTAHTVVCAIFEEKPMNNFIATSTPYEGGYITENSQTVDLENGRRVESGTKITLTAVANEDYNFKGWYRYTADQQEVQISAEATYTFTVNEATTVFAKFEEKVKYNFLAQCDPSNGGYITENNQTVDFGNGRQVDPETKITLTAVANEGYAFKGWGTRDDAWNLTILSTAATYTFTVTENTYVQAVFEEKPNGLKLDAHNAGFTYNEDGELVTTVYQIGNDIQPKIDYVGVYATYPTQQEEYLTIDEDYTRDLGGLDFTKAGTYTVTYTYKADTSLKATLTVQVVEKPADGSLTEAEWNAAMAYWKAQTNIKVFERTVTSQSDDHMGPQIMIYQLAGTAYSYDGYFENEESSQTYKGKMTYLVKTGDKYYKYTWADGEWDEAKHEYVNGFWVKDDYSAKEQYESEVSSTIYTFSDSSGEPIVFNYENFTYDAETKSYKNGDGSLAIAFTFDDNKVLTKIIVTETRVYEDTDFSSTTVSTVTFGDAVVEVPTGAKCSFSTAVTAFTTTEETYGVGGCITENGEKVSYRYAYLDDGTKLTLTAVADEGYVFKHWAKNVWDVDSSGYVWVTYSTEATYTVTVDGNDGTLYAVFEKVEAES